MLIPAIIIGAAFALIVLIGIAKLEGLLERFDEWRDGE